MKLPNVESSSDGRKKLLCLVIPTFNESENVGPLIERIERIASLLPLDLKLIFVDDNSKDGTSDIIKASMQKFGNIRLMQRPKPTGLGSAYIDGFEYALKRYEADFLGEMDADLQHPPETLPDICRKIFDGSADVVLGSRYVEGGGASGWSLGRRIISRGANTLSKICLRVPVADSTTGFRVIT
ncbi:MAG: polyprenol monophosphomannose synthase, partial [Nitrososphaerales archaeon]